MTEHAGTQLHANGGSRGSRGFTLVELLIVIVIIAVLAAITVVAYNGIQDRAHASAAQEDAHTVANLLGLSYAANGTYPSDLSTVNNGGPLPSTDGTTYTYHPGSGNTSYCSTITNGNHSFYVEDTATTPTAGACPGDGVNGVAAITNLATNPRAQRVGGWYSNNGAIWACSNVSGVAGHPLGITTAIKCNAIANSNNVLSLFDIDGLGNTSTTRWVGVWVWVSAAGYEARTGNGAYVTLSPATWTFIRTGTAVAGYSGVNIQAQSGAYVPTTDYGMATGVISVAGPGPYNYADGSSPGWVWNGTPNASTSSGPPQ